MTWLAQAQDKPGADKTEKPGTQKPAPEKTLPVPAPKDQPGVKPATGEKDKNAPQKATTPSPGAPKTEPPKADAAKATPTMTEWDKLAGEWVSANFEFDGRSYPADGRWSLIFEKQKNQELTKITGNAPTMVFWTGPVRLDATKSPNEITLVLPALIGERVQRGIYTLQGDHLTIAWATGFDAARPTNFSAQPDIQTKENMHIQAEPNQFMATWVRKKAPAPK